MPYCHFLIVGKLETGALLHDLIVIPHLLLLLLHFPSIMQLTFI